MASDTLLNVLNVGGDVVDSTRDSGDVVGSTIDSGWAIDDEDGPLALVGFLKEDLRDDDEIRGWSFGAVKTSSRASELP